ncbi:hypothetical protein ACFTWF_06415 [Rhodococcus sp. NPDC056960]|nr:MULTISPECIES: hypothetical protein [unclassified Rhodococcus (in: high G+C Gram-positive bacteria)]
MLGIMLGLGGAALGLGLGVMALGVGLLLSDATIKHDVDELSD